MKNKEQNKGKNGGSAGKSVTRTISANKFPFVIVPVVLVCIGILYSMLKTMTVDREHWVQIRKDNFEKDSVELKPNRGNILSAEGELLSSSLPNYKVRFDFLAGIPNMPKDTMNRKDYDKAVAVRDSLIRMKDSTLVANLPAISGGLAKICPALDSAGYYNHIKLGMEKHARYFDVCPGYILNYIQYNKLRELPIFNIRSKYKSGLIVEERNNRKKPFGSLARRTLGEMYGAKDSARSGLELAYDTLLRGKSGLLHQRRIRSKNVDIVDQEPVDGYDLVSTINVSMQDICETALKEKLIELNAEFGVCILMETHTGDVKAIVNLARDSVSGNYYEARNYALAAMMEPGSTFKTASIMVALDDGEITLDDKVDTGCGIYNMYGARMRDSNWARGGCGVLDVTLAVVRSSNIGVSRLIDEHYHNKPEKFIAGLKRVGIGTPLNLPFYGAANPHILSPDEKETYWSKTSLPWMSI
ncbi:MAG: penicillin-binding protein, partial [Bacteroidaceae bacterium]|nr:penicillin-binding protein [Bacteroidaceae bacterium]